MVGSTSPQPSLRVAFSHPQSEHVLTSCRRRSLLSTLLAAFQWFSDAHTPDCECNDSHLHRLTGAWSSRDIIGAYAAFLLAHTVFVAYHFASAWDETASPAPSHPNVVLWDTDVKDQKEIGAQDY